MKTDDFDSESSSDVETALSTTASHPAQLNAFLAAYRYLLDSGIDSRNIVFMGDSAGGK